MSTALKPVKEVAPGAFWFHPSDGGEVYVLCTASEKLVLIDSGLGKHRDALLAAMRNLGMEPDAVSHAFVSHFHCDHVGDLGWWRREHGVEIIAHEQAVDPMGKPDLTITGSYIPYTGFDEPFIPCTVDHPVRGGERFDIGDRVFVVEKAPGHTVSSINILCGDFVFVGDTVVESGGIGWMDAHWGSNPADYVETLKRLRQHHTGKLAFPGHGAPYILTEEIIDKAIVKAKFYIPLENGLGFPRAPSQ